ncbi:MAG: response regulator [Bacteroidetes bacterium]|nr:response regulator [Bacteroidota bacterium]
MNRNNYTHRILLVDDNEADLKLAEQALQLSDLAAVARLEHAPDGETALSEIAANMSCPFDTVILDLCLPRIGGHEVLRKIRPLCAGTPILIMTHSDNRKDIEECFINGADAYFVKPIDFDQLIFFFSALAKSFGADRRIEVPAILKLYSGYAAA